MSSNIIYPQGGLEVNIAVPSGNSIAVYTKDVARVYQILRFPNRQNLIGEVINGQVTFGPYPDGATIQINAGAAEVLYHVSIVPVVIEHKGYRIQEAPNFIGPTGILTAAMIANGILEANLDSDIVLTFDSGLNMRAAFLFGDNDSLEWSLINIDTDFKITISGLPDHSLVGFNEVGPNTSATFRTRARNNIEEEFDTYRLS